MANQKPLKFTSGKFNQFATADTIPTANLGTGTADATKYLGGDQTWKTFTNAIYSEKLTAPTSDANGTIYTSTITIGGILLKLVKVSNTFYKPQLYNNTGSSVTVSFASGSVGQTANIRDAVNTTVTNGSTINVDYDDTVYWNTTTTETLTVNFTINDANLYRAVFMAYTVGTTINMFVTLQQIL